MRESVDRRDETKKGVRDRWERAKGFGSFVLEALRSHNLKKMEGAQDERND